MSTLSVSASRMTIFPRRPRHMTPQEQDQLDFDMDQFDELIRMGFSPKRAKRIMQQAGSGHAVQAAEYAIAAYNAQRDTLAKVSKDHSWDSEYMELRMIQGTEDFLRCIIALGEGTLPILWGKDARIEVDESFNLKLERLHKGNFHFKEIPFLPPQGTQEEIERIGKGAWEALKALPLRRNGG